MTSMDERRGKTIKYDIGGVKFCDNFFKNIISYDTLKELASYKEEDKHYQKLQQWTPTFHKHQWTHTQQKWKD